MNKPDWELLDALVLVLRYFSTPSDKAQFDRVEENIIKLKKEYRSIYVRSRLERTRTHNAKREYS